MFDWLFKKKYNYTKDQIPEVALKIIDITEKLNENFIIAAVSGAKTYSSELKNNKEWGVETIQDVPDLEAALYAYQVICACGFFIRHIFNDSNKYNLSPLLNKELILQKKTSLGGKNIGELVRNFFEKYNSDLGLDKTKQLVQEDVIKYMKYPINREQEKLNNGITAMVNSIEAQIFMELANLHGNKKLVDKYMLKAGKGIGVG